MPVFVPPQLLFGHLCIVCKRKISESTMWLCHAKRDCTGAKTECAEIGNCGSCSKTFITLSSDEWCNLHIFQVTTLDWLSPTLPWTFHPIAPFVLKPSPSIHWKKTMQTTAVKLSRNCPKFYYRFWIINLFGSTLIWFYLKNHFILYPYVLVSDFRCKMLLSFFSVGGGKKTFLEKVVYQLSRHPH